MSLSTCISVSSSMAAVDEGPVCVQDTAGAENEDGGRWTRSVGADKEAEGEPCC